MPRTKGALNRPADVRVAAKAAAEQRRAIRAAFGLGSRGRFPATIKTSDGEQIALDVSTAPRFDDPAFDTPITKARREAREAKRAEKAAAILAAQAAKAAAEAQAAPAEVATES